MTSNIQKESIKNGALNNIVDHEKLFLMDLNECFKSLILYRYHNFVAESEEDYLRKEWIDIDYNEMIYSANLETSLFGDKSYDIFCIGYENKVRLISYKSQEDYYSILNLKNYDLTECIISKIELEQIINQIESTIF